MAPLRPLDDKKTHYYLNLLEHIQGELEMRILSRLAQMLFTSVKHKRQRPS